MSPPTLCTSPAASQTKRRSPPSARETSQMRSLKRLSGSPSAQVGTSCRFQSSGGVGKRVPRGTMTVCWASPVFGSWVTKA